jgi:uncharacterized protein YndB with AHSA1/START domain
MEGEAITNTVYIKTSLARLWKALTDGDDSVQYVGGRVQSTWEVGDRIAYLTPDGKIPLVEGKLLEVVPNKRIVFECRLVFDPVLAADGLHREIFEIEQTTEDVCRCTATFDQYPANSPTYVFQNQGSMQKCGSSLKSLLETGHALDFPRQVPPVPTQVELPACQTHYPTSVSLQTKADQ